MTSVTTISPIPSNIVLILLANTLDEDPLALGGAIDRYHNEGLKVDHEHLDLRITSEHGVDQS